MITTRAFKLHKETVQLLRFPFSLYLAPVFLFGLSQVPFIHWPHAFLIFVVLHLLVYPASNGFNSYMDRDTTSIGGLEKPPLPTAELYFVTLTMDVMAVLLSLLIRLEVAILVALYILASRAYSDRRVRLKKYPWMGFFVVTVFQGGITYLIVFLSISQQPLLAALQPNVLICMLVSSLIIGASYPLTQIYQHKADKNNGDVTLSYLLGYTGTFIFSAIFFSAAVVLLFVYFNALGHTWMFFMFIIYTIPIVAFFAWWGLRVFQNPKHANFKNTMRMNTISAASLALYFLTLTFIL
jgi:1,4-dihydroxy-2-naphthoate polyprenyltransferase